MCGKISTTGIAMGTYSRNRAGHSSVISSECLLAGKRRWRQLRQRASNLSWDGLNTKVLITSQWKQQLPLRLEHSTSPSSWCVSQVHIRIQSLEQNLLFNMLQFKFTAAFFYTLYLRIKLIDICKTMDKAKVPSTACANMKNIDITVEKCWRNVTDSKILTIPYAIT